MRLESGCQLSDLPLCLEIVVTLQDFLTKDEKLEGLISFLASRPHDWKTWKIERQRILYLATGLVGEEILALELENAQGESLRAVSAGSQWSPSKFLSELLGNRPKAEAPTFETLGAVYRPTGADELLKKTDGPVPASHVLRREIRQFMKPRVLNFFFKNQ